jgi:hypothetical protein
MRIPGWRGGRPGATQEPAESGWFANWNSGASSSMQGKTPASGARPYGHMADISIILSMETELFVKALLDRREKIEKTHLINITIIFMIIYAMKRHYASFY